MLYGLWRLSKRDHSKSWVYSKKALKFNLLCFVVLGPWLGLMGFVEASSNLDLNDPPLLITACSVLDCQRDLKTWEMPEIIQLKKRASWEKDPISKKMVKWEGVLLSEMIEKSLKELSLEQRAHIDLIVLKGRDGGRAVIPRALVSKYPILLALKSDKLKESSKLPEDRGKIYSVIPWSSKPKILKEDLPLERYFVSDINRIELTNYRHLYGFFYLSRRTDPSAVRGEKIFVQNCAGCHSPLPVQQGLPSALILTLSREMRISPEGTAAHAFAGEQETNGMYVHPIVQGAPKLNERDQRSIRRYLEEYGRENPTVVENLKSMRTSSVSVSGEPVPEQNQVHKTN